MSDYQTAMLDTVQQVGTVVEFAAIIMIFLMAVIVVRSMW